MITLQTTGLAEERLDRMRALLRDRRIARVDELSRDLRVSAATVRRDLLELDRRGHARRVHGGAVAVEGRLEEPVFEAKATRAAKEKQRIAQAALQFVKPSDSIFLDGGSTVLALAHLLTEMTALTVVTNSLRVASVFTAGGPRMILTGGEFRSLSQTLVGFLSRPVIERLRLDTAFIGTLGLTDAAGLTTTDPREAETKALVMQHARQVIALADGSKIGNISFVAFGQAEDLDVLITDGSAPKAELRSLRKKTRVLTA